MHQRLLNGESIVITPRHGRDARSVALAIALAVAPPLVALLALTWNTPGLATVVRAGTALALVGLLIAFAVKRMQVLFSPDSITERTLLGRVIATPISELATVRVINVYSGRSLETHTQVFFLDREGRTRHRLKGLQWGDRVAVRASVAYDLPVDRIVDPVGRGELRQRFGAALHSYERHPIMWLGAQMLAVVALGVPLLGVLTAVS